MQHTYTYLSGGEQIMKHEITLQQLQEKEDQRLCPVCSAPKRKLGSTNSNTWHRYCNNHWHCNNCSNTGTIIYRNNDVIMLIDEVNLF